jgi:hypothetical protein
MSTWILVFVFITSWDVPVAALSIPDLKSHEECDMVAKSVVTLTRYSYKYQCIEQKK